MTTELEDSLASAASIFRAVSITRSAVSASVTTACQNLARNLFRQSSWTADNRVERYK